MKGSGSCALVIQHCRQDFPLSVYKDPNDWHLSVPWASRRAVSVDNESLHRDVLCDFPRGLGQIECIHTA